MSQLGWWQSWWKLMQTPSLERNRWLFFVTTFFSGLIFIIPIWVLFERRILTLGQMALLEAVATGLTLVLELPTGALADLWGRKASAGLGLILQGVGNIISGFAHEPIQFIVGYFISCIGVALWSGASDALLYDSLKELRQESQFSRVSSTNSMMFQVGIVVASLLGGYMYTVGMFWPYLLYGSALVVAGLGYFLMVEPSIDSQVFTLKNYVRQTVAGVKELSRTDSAFKVSIFYILIGGITWSAQIFFNQNYAVELLFTPVQVGWLFALTRIINSVVIWRLAHAAWLTRRRAFLLFAVLVVVAYLPGYWAQQWLGAGLLALSTFASTARHILLGQYCNQEFRSQNRATAISALNMGVSLFYVIAMLVGGPVMEQHSTKLMYTILGVFALVTVWPLTHYVTAQKAEKE